MVDYTVYNTLDFFLMQNIRTIYFKNANINPPSNLSKYKYKRSAIEHLQGLSCLALAHTPIVHKVMHISAHEVSRD